MKTIRDILPPLRPLAWGVLFAAAGIGAEKPAVQPAPAPLFAAENLVAWCIVPFDNLHRTPGERMAMLQRLGFKQYAWDWRQEHLKDLPAEIKAAHDAGIRLRAVWLWIEGGSDAVGKLGAGNQVVMDTFKAAGLPVEYWVGFHPNFLADLDEPARIRKTAAMMTYLRDEAAKAGSTVAFYNHGDWIGEPDNQIKVIQAMGKPAVGIVFNFHHAHTMLKEYPGLVQRMKPYLTAVNLNGMRPEGPKILPLGQGTHEKEMIRLLQDSGYSGPIGILGHVEDRDIEGVLRANLEGLRMLTFAPVPAPEIPPRTGPTERTVLADANTRTLDGWDGSSEWWSVQDGALVAKATGKVPTSFLLTRKNYSDFRLTLWARVIQSENHIGVALWGEQAPGRDPANRWAYKGPLVCFPGVYLWDYHTNKSIPIDPADMAYTKEHIKQHDWIQVEILAQGNRLRAAFNGHQVLDWREPDPGRLKAGPIGLQLHGHDLPQEVVYKDIVIETFPKENRLLTVKD